MTQRSAPEWLAELQARFGAVLRTPLEPTFAAKTSSYPREALLDVVDRPGARAEDRLAVYNRQYWLRLFGALGTAFPTTARVLGQARFTDHATRFLRERPPSGWDLERVPDGFDGFLVSALAGEELVLDAAALDAARRALTRAPVAAPFRPAARDAARLADAQLAPSPSAKVIVERWLLLDLDRSPARVEPYVLERLPAPRFWILLREAEGIRRWRLEPREGELLLLLMCCSVRDALAQLEASCATGERAALPARVQRWLARAAERGLFAGIRD